MFIVSDLKPQTIDKLPDEARSIRKDFIENGSFNSVAGAGWSLLKELGVRSPEKEEFDLAHCMRESEIVQTDKELAFGFSIEWKGPDGAGKTTFLSELMAYYASKDVKALYIPGTYGRNPQFFESFTDTLNHVGVSSGNNKVVILIDSVDYFWEETGNTALKVQRLNFLKRLKDDGYKVVFTVHKPEPANKEVDYDLRRECKSIFHGLQTLVHDLDPNYSVEKVNSLLLRVGLPQPVVSYLLNNCPGILRHATLANYILNKSGEQNFSRLIGYVNSCLKPNDDIARLSQNLTIVVNARDRIREEDLRKFGF